jgi:predicted RNase H-like HicB family nuclease
MVSDRLCQGLCQELLKPSAAHFLELPGSIPEAEIPRRPVNQTRNWDKNVSSVIRTYANALLAGWREATRLDAIETEVLLLKERVAQVERSAPVCVPIETFAPEPYKVLKPFHVVVQAQEDEYVASFLDANLNASGSTQAEAVSNLKDVILAVFDCLNEQQARLGPGPARQLGVLTEFVGRSA